MSELKIGLQLFSVRNALQKDLEDTLKKVASIGYEYVEIAVRNLAENGEFSPEVSAERYKKYLDTFQLKAMGTHIGYHEQLNLSDVAEYNKKLGSNKVIIPAYFFATKKEAYEFADWLNRAGEALRKENIQLYYHNHYHEFQEIEEEIVYEILVKETNPAFVQFEFDTFWALRGGQDPVEYLEKLGERCTLVHQKDLNKDADPINLLKGKTGVLDSHAVFSPVDHSDFVEIGTGKMDIQAIISQLVDKGNVEYIIVEQDRTIKGELESIEESYQALSKLLRIGDKGTN